MKFTTLIKQLRAGKSTLFAVLVDPDKFNPEVITQASRCHASCFLVGGSKLHSGDLTATVKKIKQLTQLPVVLFPGDEHQLCPQADGVLLPSLVSGRNAEYLIGKQVLMAPKIKRMKLNHASMAYLLFEGKRVSTTRSVTNTAALEVKDKKKVLDTALAASMLGFSLLYLEAGSGASESIPADLIRSVKSHVELPLIVGGGIDSAAKTRKLIGSGANMLVIGNAFEKDVSLIAEIGACFSRRKTPRSQE